MVIRAQPGIVEVRLPESPTTGYRWRLAQPSPAGVTLAGDAFFPDAPALAGGGGTRVFRFDVSSTGTFVLAFALARAWTLSAPLEQRTVTLEISSQAP